MRKNLYRLGFPSEGNPVFPAYAGMIPEQIIRALAATNAPLGLLKRAPPASLDRPGLCWLHRDCTIKRDAVFSRDPIPRLLPQPTAPIMAGLSVESHKEAACVPRIRGDDPNLVDYCKKLLGAQRIDRQ